MAPASALAQTVRVNWHTTAPFSSFKTYAWKTSKRPSSHFYQQWVRRDVDAELAKKGMREVALNQKPDLLIMYRFVSDEVLDSTTTDDGFGWGGGPWGWAGGWGGMGMDDTVTTEQEPRTLGILSVDLVNAQRKELVWRGQATEDNVSDTQKGDEKQVLKSIDKMFAQYPPKRKR